MKIEHIQRRAGGTKIPMGQQTYHFKEEVSDGPHLADVVSEDHAARFLAIPEGFRLPEGERPTALVAPVTVVPTLSNHPAILTIAGRELPLEEAVHTVLGRLEMNVPTWNALSELERFDHVEAYLQTLVPVETGVPEEGGDTAGLKPSDIPPEQRLQGAPEDAVTPQKPVAERSDKQLKALAKTFGIDENLSRADLITALSAYPVK